MNPNTQFERDLGEWLQAEAPASAPAGFHATVMDRARTLRQRPDWATSLSVRRFGRGRGMTLLAAVALLLVGGAMAAGSGLVKLPSLVPPVPVPTPPVAVASPSPAVETPSPVVSPSTAETPWITGQELMDALSAEYGLRWTPLLDSETSTVTYLSSDPFGVEAPFDRPAKVRVAAGTNAVAGVGLQAGRIAQALAPDAAPWIQEAITQGLSADWDSFATSPSDLTSVNREKVMTTASGGQVRVTFVDPPVFGNYLSVTFLFPPPPPRLVPSGSGVVLYPDGDEIWAVNPDGTDPHLLVEAAAVWWSADGSRLFYDDRDGSVFAIDTDGSPPVRIGDRCPVVMADDDCAPGAHLAASPDGTRLAISETAILDIVSGQITTLDLTPLPGADVPCSGRSYGNNSQPTWSPDGTHLVFARGGIGPKVNATCRSAMYTVAIDGSGLRQIMPPRVVGFENHEWSPDGSTIVFSAWTPQSAWDGQGDDTAIPMDFDIYAIRPDGSGLTALTSDGRSISPRWTSDGRIVFIRREREPSGPLDGASELRIMDADGSNATTLDSTVAAQTAAGCLVCPYFDGEDFSYRYWRPMPEGQP